MAAGDDALKDRLARLLFLCSEIGRAAKLAKVPTDRLEDILTEAERLSRDVRKELRRRDR